MFKDDIRPYELSLWTLQDGFITVLKTINLSPKGQIEAPQIIIKNDGTQELSFSIPMYYQNNGRLIENPIWYNTRNGVLLVNLRKLKVIFNKGQTGEEVFEFVINKVTETHSEGQLQCKVEAEGLSFQELGKVGYKISLSEDEFTSEYEEWWNKTVNSDGSGDYKTEAEKAKDEPIANLQYWCNKVFKNSRWTYSITMDWTSYDGVAEKLTNKERENLGLRRKDKIYEEEYISSWEVNGNTLIPKEKQSFKEKARMVNIEKSNMYNITQTLAETFGVYCKYKYHYDENYHIIKKECIFYNNYLSETGKIDINYPYDSSQIERQIDSMDIVTKMYVTPLESDESPSGLITIAEASANKAKEDYILNFDYLYSIGTITEEQYKEISSYERQMLLLNSKIEPISLRLANLQSDLVEYKAKKASAAEAKKSAQEQMDQSQRLMAAITEGDGEIEVTTTAPYSAILLPETAGSTKYYVKITKQGVKNEEDKPITIYYKKKDADGKKVDELIKYTDTTWKVVKDSNGNITQIKNLKLMEDSFNSSYYFTFFYEPQLYYTNIYNTFANILSVNDAAEKEADTKIEEIEKKIDTLEERYNSLLETKQKEISDFENMMGPAIKEGSWQAENYSSYDSKFEETAGLDPEATGSSNKFLQFVWDNKPFEEEQLNYYYPDANISDDNKVYYPCISLDGRVSDSDSAHKKLYRIRNNLDNLTFIYNANEQMIIGSKMQYGFLRKKTDKSVIPVLLLTDTNFDVDAELVKPTIGTITTKVENGTPTVTRTDLFTVRETDWINFSPKDYEFVYPRLVIKSPLLKSGDSNLFLKIKDGRDLKNFYDYSLLRRDNDYYLTLNSKVIISDNKMEKSFVVNYTLSNASLALYLDALEVAKTNAFPQVSYTISVSALNRNFMNRAYQKLNTIVNINDSDLKFKNIQGYISELNLNLENPWEDSIVIQNYKTKFEDLFSTIVASSEQMKVNSFSYGLAAGAFNTNGTLKQTTVQNSLSRMDLDLAFQKGALTIDEENGIWATSDSGVVAMRGGGIFCANQKDSNNNWIWNTGITPEGINASLITAGQLDTNLIKIFAGDNLRLQLNADGLFAFKNNSAGEADLKTYVVHNSDGLFLTKIINGKKINQVEISWDGLILRNGDNKKVFFADTYGNLTVSAGAKIANWTIEENAISSMDGKAGLRSSVDEGAPLPYDVFWVTGAQSDNSTEPVPTFRVDSGGHLFARHATFSGKVSADSFIGNITQGSLSEILKLSAYNYEGEVFHYWNRNLDGIITKEPNYLMFEVKLNGLNNDYLPAGRVRETEQNSDGTYNWWRFYYCSPGDNTLEEALENKNNNVVWKPLARPNENTLHTAPFYKFDINYLMQYFNDSIFEMEPDIKEKMIYIKVEIDGFTFELDEEGQVIPLTTENGAPIYENGIQQFKKKEETYKVGYRIALEEHAINKILSQIEPPSYTFSVGQTVLNPEPATFSVTLTDNDLDNSNASSSIYLSSLDLNEDGYWSANGVLIQRGNIIDEDNRFKEIKENGNIVGYQIIKIDGTIENEFRINEDGSLIDPTISNFKPVISEGKIEKYQLLNENNKVFFEIYVNANKEIIGFKKNHPDGYIIENKNIEKAIICTITVPHALIAEGQSMVLSYNVQDINTGISAYREAQIFKTKSGTDGYITRISSSNGTTFRNGIINTILEAELYAGITRLNGEGSTGYYYVWKEIEDGITTVITTEDEIKDDSNKRFLEITSGSFSQKALYKCEIYTNIEDAKNAIKMD